MTKMVAISADSGVRPETTDERCDEFVTFSRVTSISLGAGDARLLAALRSLLILE